MAASISRPDISLETTRATAGVARPIPVSIPEEHVTGLSSLCEQALRFAAVAHVDQKRKASDVPYLMHPCAVAMILLRAGVSDDRILAAALLHDTVEDTVTTAADLQREFPAEVCEIVGDLTEQKTDAHGEKRPWEARKQDHIAHIAQMSDAARSVLLADKLHNLSAMLYDLQQAQHEDDVWNQFSRPKDKVIWYHEQILSAIGASDDKILQPLMHECHRLLEAIKSFNAH